MPPRARRLYRHPLTDKVLLNRLNPRRYHEKSGKSGPVAQMGARVNGIHEVTGSIPVWSTNLNSSPPTRQMLSLIAWLS